jgi:hypothetical protein
MSCRVQVLALKTEAGMLASVADQAAEHLRKDFLGRMVHAENLTFFARSVRSAIRALEQAREAELAAIAGGGA